MRRQRWRWRTKTMRSWFEAQRSVVKWLHQALSPHAQNAGPRPLPLAEAADSPSLSVLCAPPPPPTRSPSRHPHSHALRHHHPAQGALVHHRGAPRAATQVPARHEHAVTARVATHHALAHTRTCTRVACHRSGSRRGRRSGCGGGHSVTANLAATVTTSVPHGRCHRRTLMPCRRIRGSATGHDGHLARATRRRRRRRCGNRWGGPCATVRERLQPWWQSADRVTGG